MNKPIHPVIPSGETSPDYEADAHGWAIAQTAFLKERRFDAIDWDNVAEEIEDVAKRQRDKARSHLRQLIVHILKWDYQSERRSRSWSISIAKQRLAYQAVIDDSPSLAARADGLLDAVYRRSCKEAALEIGLDLEIFPPDPPSWETLLERPFDLPTA